MEIKLCFERWRNDGRGFTRVVYRDCAGHVWKQDERSLLWASKEHGVRDIKVVKQFS